MAFSKLSHLKAAVLRLPNDRILSYFRLPFDGSFVVPRWAANARAFCCKVDGVHDSGALESRVSVMERKSDETIENAEGARSVLSLCNQKRVDNITTFPPEVLESNDRLFELFEAWMVEYETSYASEEEKLRRFEVFKENVFSVNEENSRSTSYKLTLNWMSDHEPGEKMRNLRDISSLSYYRNLFKNGN